jgi:hypothetical protein
MARPLRIHVAGGWYHVTARGQRRDVIIDGAGDYRKFLQLVADMRARVYGGLTLAELGREAGGMDYSAVSMPTVRVDHLAKKDRSLRQAMTALKPKCEKE